MQKMVQLIKAKVCRYWFIVLIWAEWAAIYIGRSLFVPFIYKGGDAPVYDAFKIGDLFCQGSRADAPIYGTLLDIFEVLFGEGRFAAVVILQTVISAIALIYFYKALRLAGIRETIARWILILYGFSLSASTWNICVLTESLSLSGFIFVLYNVIKFLRYRQMHNGMVAIWLTFALVFLRPQFLLHYAVLACYFVLRALLEKTERGVSLKLVVACAGGGILILGYCCLFMNAYGIFSISTAKGRQQLRVCVEQGFYKNYPDKNLVEAIDKILEETVEMPQSGDSREMAAKALFSSSAPTKPIAAAGPAASFCFDLYGHKGVEQLANEWIRRNLRGYVRYLLRTVVAWSTASFEGGGSPETPLDNLKIGHVILISAL